MPEKFAFPVGPIVYIPVITRKKLRQLDGKAAEGQAWESDRTLRISHRLPLAERERVLRHEYYHAWLFSVPKPRNEEESAQLNALISEQFTAAYAKGGGAKALMAMKPDDLADTEPAKAPTGHELLRRVKYPGLTDEYWAYFLELCAAKGVDPWSDQLSAKLVPDVATNSFRLALIVTIEFMRSRAIKSKEYAGMDAPVEKYGPNGQLISIQLTVYRMVTGQRCAFTAVARFDEYAPYALGDFSKNMPHGWLEKCCESKVLRRAFAEEIGDMYSQEEMMQVANRPAGRSAARTEEVVDEPWHDDVPEFQAVDA